MSRPLSAASPDEAIVAVARCAARRLRVLGVIALTAVIAAACGTSSPTRDALAAGVLGAEVASYDLVVGRPGRFIVGVFTVDRERGLAYGTVELRFRTLDTSGGRADGPLSAPVTAEFLPIPGQHPRTDASAPALVPASEVIGVYGAHDVTFDHSGYWEIEATATIDGRDQTTTAVFNVQETSKIPAPSDPAPRTRQALPGAPGVAPRAIDSRADDTHPLPDPELHGVTIADAIAAGKPTVVVIATPVYCVSQFCGPITDSVAELARRYAGQAAFVHLEIWSDFDTQTLNDAVRDWIFPPGAEDAYEPWVFIIGRDGLIRDRFDNVATDAELDAAIQAAIRT